MDLRKKGARAASQSEGLSVMKMMVGSNLLKAKGESELNNYPYYQMSKIDKLAQIKGKIGFILDQN